MYRISINKKLPANQKKSFATHDGLFHADEVTACAFLLSYGLIDGGLIFRSRDLQVLRKCEYVCDVGGIYDPAKKRFDHHPAAYTGELSSAGMILKYLKDEKIIAQDLFTYFRDHFVRGVDLYDIGKACLVKGTASFSQVIANFLPVKYNASQAEMDRAFKKALWFVLEYIEKLKKRFLILEENRRIIKKAMQAQKKSALDEKPYLVFEKPFSWVEPFFKEGGEKYPIFFVVMKMKDSWKIRTVPPSLEKRMQMRKPLPKAWAGLEGVKLEKAAKIKGAIFCHKQRFVAFFKTRKAVFKALEKALKT